MIKQYEPGVLESPSCCLETLTSPQLLTVRPNSVIVIRCPKDEYSLDEMNILRDYYSKVFPNNKICVMFDDINIEIIHDKSWKNARPCAEENYDPYNYN
jgi:hypothetical protein